MCERDIMRKNIFKKSTVFIILAVMLAVMLAACKSSVKIKSERSTPAPTLSASEVTSFDADSTQDEVISSSSQANAFATELYVTFGNNGSAFTMNLYDNETAEAIARHVGTADWRLPIYSYDGYDNWEVMQYYDIPSRYEIPSNPETVRIEKSGAVYYSEPNRIVLFYGDAEVSGDYTLVGYFEPTDEFVKAVRDNPIIEGWGNKIIKISVK